VNLEKLNHWLQFGASIGVIAGLILVAYELRQDHDLTRATLGAEAWTAYEEQTRSQQSEVTSRALAKAYESPSEMTFQDHIIVDGFYWEVISVQLMREDYLEGRGIFVDDIRRYARFTAESILASDHGRAWWEENRTKIEQRFVELVDQAAADNEIRPHADMIEAIEDRLRHSKEQE